MNIDIIPTRETLSARFQEAFEGVEIQQGPLWPSMADKLADVAREVMTAEALVRKDEISVQRDGDVATISVSGVSIDVPAEGLRELVNDALTGGAP